MTIPTDAVVFAEVMDPADLMEYEANMTDLLDNASAITSFTIALLPDAILAGVQIKSGAAYDPGLVLVNKAIDFWLEVQVADRENVAYTAGIRVGVVITINTNHVPARRRQRTFVVNVRQR